MSNLTYQHDLVTKYATEIQPTWPNKDKAKFHFYNPRGLVAQKRCFDARLDKLAKEGRVTVHDVNAYGSGAEWSVRQLRNLLATRSVRKDHLERAVNRLLKMIAGAQTHIAKAERLDAIRAELSKSTTPAVVAVRMVKAGVITEAEGREALSRPGLIVVDLFKWAAHETVAEQKPEFPLGQQPSKHLYELGTDKGNIEVHADTRTQAGSIARRAGYVVRDVNLVG